MAKQRIGVRLRESVGGSKSNNQWGDLKTLATKYQGFRQRLRELIISLHKHHNMILAMEAARTSVANNFAALSKASPLWDATGLKPSADHPSDTVCSYASVHDVLGAKTKSYAAKYKQFVIDYAEEWEKVVTERIDAGLKKTEELRRELDHYQKKTEAIRLTVNQQMAKGKNVKSEAQEKLRRNEEKLLGAKQSHSKCATDLCILMEEVTERSWRDLHPLLIKCAQFDSTLSNDESKILVSLNQVVNKLKNVAVANGISPQPRLKDLSTLKPELISTRPGGVSGLAIEAGPSNGSVFGTKGVTLPSNDALPPGSVGPQGMGGFPVQISSSQSSPISTSAMTSTSNYDPLSTLSMLTISQSSAPAPTYNDVYSTNNYSSIRSAPSSGNMPPLAPGRSMSFNGGYSNGLDSDSVYSGYTTTSLPTSPPPLPPMAPPPPPPTAGNYGHYAAQPAPGYNISSSYHGSPTPVSDMYGHAPVTPSWSMDPSSTFANNNGGYTPTNYAQSPSQPVMSSHGTNPFG